MALTCLKGHGTCAYIWECVEWLGMVCGAGEWLGGGRGGWFAGVVTR